MERSLRITGRAYIAMQSRWVWLLLGAIYSCWMYPAYLGAVWGGVLLSAFPDLPVCKRPDLMDSAALRVVNGIRTDACTPFKDLAVPSGPLTSGLTLHSDQGSSLQGTAVMGQDAVQIGGDPEARC